MSGPEYITLDFELHLFQTIDTMRKALTCPSPSSCSCAEAR